MDFLDDLFEYKNSTVTCGLTDELNVFYVLGLFKKVNDNIVIVTSSLYEANNYYNLLQAYTSDVLLYVCDDFVISSIKSASPELKLTRLNTIDRIPTGKHIIITNIMAYLSYLPDKQTLLTRFLNIAKNDKYNRDYLINKLDLLGYHRDSITTATGDFSVRGMIIDVFAINEVHPFRIEFDDDVIDDIRYFDETTQCSLNVTDKIIIKSVDEVKTENHTTLYDFIGNPYIVYIDKPQIMVAYNKIISDKLDLLDSNSDYNIDVFNFEDIIPKYDLELNNFKDSKSDIQIVCKKIDNFNQNFELLKEKYYIWIKDGYKIVFFLSNKEENKKILDIIPEAKIINKKINHGFIVKNYVFISEYDIENITRNYKYQNNLYGGKRITSYNELKNGDYVVHISHGIGVYSGLKTLTKNGVSKDYIMLCYAGTDKIYVPVEKISNIYKYSDSDGTRPKLDKLNSSNWLKTKKYVQSKIEDISKELMNLYRQRALQKNTPYKQYPEEDIFDSEFVYDLTKDQQKAINDINNDLKSQIPMDRLLCGDVGFGKTEVAMRAIFKAVLNNEQVAYLCPTTILSAQQCRVIKNRFASWPIEICLLNRFTSQKECKRIYEGLKKGTIDVVVGTHKLLNDQISYKNLGLLVVDEEQRFGVKHKEKIKEIKNNINVLTLSATPIPRTLKMALSGLRDLSIIDTAPSNRYPVQTYVINENDLIVKDAIFKELSRGGQVFILYNRVETIEEKTNHIRELIPNEEIRFANGQMSKEELENIMDDFIKQKFNILVCTTIIESGIDIPNANTLIVYDSDRLGLAQLYQLRGRVGRSDKVAYAYLMYDNNKMLNDIAIKRLQAIREFTELGSGYRIAMRDLSIRGSGDIFGSSQAGFVDSVGIALYTKMLEDEMKRQKGEIVEEDSDDQSLINVDTHIDDDYVSDEDIKIEIHSLINEIDTYDKLNEIKLHLEDRFGKISEQLENYMYEEWFEKIAQKLNITHVIQTDRYVEIELPEELSSKIKGDKLLYTSYSINKNFNLSYRHKCIIITLYFKNLEEHFVKYVARLLNTLD